MDVESYFGFSNIDVLKLEKFHPGKANTTQKTTSGPSKQTTSVASKAAPMVSSPVYQILPGEVDEEGSTNSAESQPNTTRLYLQSVIEHEIEKNKDLQETIKGLSCKSPPQLHHHLFKEILFLLDDAANHEILKRILAANQASFKVLKELASREEARGDAIIVQ